MNYEQRTTNPRGVHQSPGSGKRHCDPWGDPKTAVAPLPRARSDPGGIFPTADFAPLHNEQRTINNEPLTIQLWVISRRLGW
ncbi:MAG: hypothetical protein ACHBN1_38035 [Heteroscytonema crispum UTEX LB 1556]